MRAKPLGSSLLIISLLSATSTFGSAGASRELLLVANKGNQTLAIVDLAAGCLLATVPENGVTGHEVAASPDGKRAFVPIFGNAGVGRPGTDGTLLRVIDLERRQVTGTVDFARPMRPHCAVFGPRNGLLYVTTELDHSVTVVDPQALKVVGTIPTGQAESHMLAISRDGRRGYTSNVGPGTISVLDLEAKRLVTVIPVSPKAQRIALSVDDRWGFTADQTQPRLAVIATSSNALHSWVPLPGFAYGTAPTPDGNSLVVTLPRISQIGLLDLQRMKLVRTLGVPKAPQEVLVHEDGKTAYVSCDASGQVAIIDLKNWRVEKLIDTGPGADGLALARLK